MAGNKQVGNYAFVTDQPLKAMMKPLHWLRLKTLKSTGHGKGSEVFACRLPLLGEVTLIPSHHQDVSTSQLPHSQPLTPLLHLFSLAGCDSGRRCPGSPAAAAPQLLVTRSSVGSVRRSTHCRGSLQGKGPRVPPTPSPTWWQRRSHNPWTRVRSQLRDPWHMGCSADIRMICSKTLLT